MADNARKTTPKAAAAATREAERAGVGVASLTSYIRTPHNWGENVAALQRKAVKVMPADVGARIESVAVSNSGTGLAIPVTRSRVDADLAKTTAPSEEEIGNAVARQNNPKERDHGANVWATCAGCIRRRPPLRRRRRSAPALISEQIAPRTCCTTSSLSILDRVPALRPIPLNTGGPLAPEDVIGREREVADVFRSLASVGVVITGERRMGKTSLARVIARDARARGWTVVSQSAEGFTTVAEFSEALIHAHVGR